MQTTDDRIQIDGPKILKYMDDYSIMSGHTPEQAEGQQKQSRYKGKE
jgi:hypothetical protein